VMCYPAVTVCCPAMCYGTQKFCGWPAVRSALIEFAEGVTSGGGDVATQEAACDRLQAYARKALDRE
jgi:hypothetical protein